MKSGGTCAGLTDISMFNGSDFASWRENLMIVFAFMDWDLPFREDRPTVDEQSTSTEKKLREKWDRSNHLCLMIMKRFIPEAFWGTNSDETVTAKEFLENIEKRLRNVRNEKSEISTLLENLASTKYKIEGNIREHITEMSSIVSKLGALELEISEEILVHFVLISLPSQFEQFKMNYISQKETWSLDELITHCVQEDERLKQDFGSKKKARRANKKRKREEAEKDDGKEAADRSTQEKQEEGKKSTDDTGCFFCGAAGHIKKQCHNYHAWLAKKGITDQAKMKATGGTGCELQGNKSSKPSAPKLLMPSKKLKVENLHEATGGTGCESQLGNKSSKPSEPKLLMPSKKLKAEKPQEPCDTQGNTKHLPHNRPQAASNTIIDPSYSSIEIGHSRVFVPKDDSPKGTIDGSNLYVAGLPQSVHNNWLIELFKPFGKILHSTVVMDANTSLSKGYGFVKNADSKSAANAIAGMNGTIIEGKRIAVRVAGAPPGNVPVHKTSKSDRSCQIAANPMVQKNKFVPVNAPDNVPVSTVPNSDRTGPSNTTFNQPPFPVSMVNSSIQPRYNSSSGTAPNWPYYPMSPGFPTAFCPARRSAEMPVVNKSGIFPTAEDFATFPGYLRSFDDPKTAVSLLFDIKPRVR